MSSITDDCYLHPIETFNDQYQDYKPGYNHVPNATIPNKGVYQNDSQKPRAKLTDNQQSQQHNFSGSRSNGFRLDESGSRPDLTVSRQDRKDGHRPNGYKPNDVPLRLGRLDSGVEDLDSPNSEVQLRTMGPAKSYEYEYVARPSHFYEELPRVQNSHVPYSSSETLTRSDVTQPTWLHSPSTESRDFITDKALRKRNNPLYEGIVSRYPDGKCHEPTQPQSCTIGCLCAFSAFCLIVALGSLGLSVYILVTTDVQSGLRKTEIEQFESLYSRLSEKMSAKVKDLQKQKSRLNSEITQLSSQISSMNKSININSGHINMNQKLQTTLVNQMAMDLTQFNRSVSSKLTQITKMEGPPGAGNLSACYHFNNTDRLSGASFIVQKTRWLPHGNILKDYVVTGAGCSVYGGTFHSLVSRINADKSLQYQCHCDGVIAGINYTLCTIYMWLCPRIS